MTLYNLHSADGQWIITKFDNDLNIESSYAVSDSECACPAGSRPVCRHRTMLPKMLAVGAEDSGMFYNYDSDQFLEPITGDTDIISPLEPEFASAASESSSQPTIAHHIELPLESTPEKIAEAFADVRRFARAYGTGPQKMTDRVNHAITGTLKRRI